MSTTISELIGFSSTFSLSNATALSIDMVDPNDYPALASSAKQLNLEIQSAYTNALLEKEKQDLNEDRYFIERAREYVELNDQVDTSAALLTELSSFLSNFQRDLSAVSGHISDLQGRSKTIEGRLDSRKAIERSLHPLLASIIITPDLINIIMDTEVGIEWVPAVIELDAKLGVIRSGPRVESRRVLDEAAEALRIRASQKILLYLLAALKPFSLTVNASITLLQSTVFLPVKPLFDFLRRHSARQAHEFQKAYTSTIRWFYETGFRRYVRGLEAVRLRTAGKLEEIGVVTTGFDASLDILSRTASAAPLSNTQMEEDHSRIDGPNAVLASMANTKNIKPSPEALFRSISLVMMDNAETEYEFIASFFGHHSDLPILETARPPPSPRSASFSASSSTSSLPLPSPTRAASISPASPSSSTLGRRRDSFIDVNRFEVESNLHDDESGSDSGMLGDRMMLMREARGEKLRKVVVDALWKGIMEPAQEYARNFVTALFDPVRCSPSSVLTMIRLNDEIIATLVADQCCPPMENYLIGIRLALWPLFQRVMGLQVDSLRRINGSVQNSGVNVFAKAAVKDSAVQIIALRYVTLFNQIVTLCTDDEEDDLVFTSMLRLRAEVTTLLMSQASKMVDPVQAKAFLSTHFNEILARLNIGKSDHVIVRRQREIAYFRELALA